MSGKNRISAADLPARYQAQVARQLYYNPAQDGTVVPVRYRAQVAAERRAHDTQAAIDRIFTAGTKPMTQMKKRLRQSTKPLIG
jgi:hypothetical protein